MPSESPTLYPMQAAVELYKRLKDQASILGEAGFVQRHGGWYFLSVAPQEQKDQIPFVTQVHDLGPRDTVSFQPLSEEEIFGAPEWLWKVEKTSQNAWTRRISVGRATNNDIVIRHDSVSKLHAHFHMPAPAAGDPGAPERCLLTDAESSNGTFVNGVLLSPESSVELKVSDRIVFGTVSGHFLDAAALHIQLNAADWF